MKKLTLTLLLTGLLISLTAQNWQAVGANTLPANFDYYSLHVVNADVVWAVGDSVIDVNDPIPPGLKPVVLRTIDGGLNWDYMPVTEAAGRHVWDIYAFDANTAIITTNKFDNDDDRPVFKTTDGGISWSQIVPPNRSGGLMVHFFDNQNGLVINHREVSITADGGDTWTAIPSGNMPVWIANEFNYLFSVGNYYAHSGDRFWVGTTKGRVFRTLDKGLHWDVKQVAPTNDNIMSIAFTDDQHGVLAVPNSSTAYYGHAKLYVTNNGGDTWTPVSAAPMGEVTTIAAVPGAPGHFFAGSTLNIDDTEPLLALNTNSLAPDAWENQLDSFYLRCAEFVSPTVGYAVGFSISIADTITIHGDLWYKNYIYKWTGNLTAAKEPGQQSALEGYSVFPNPATNFVFIKIDKPDAGQILALTLSDAHGRAVFYTESPSYDGSVDMHALPTGVYVLKVKTTKGTGVWKIVKER